MGCLSPEKIKPNGVQKNEKAQKKKNSFEKEVDIKIGSPPSKLKKNRTINIKQQQLKRQQAQKDCERGEKEFKDRRYQEANLSFRAAIKADPTFHNAYKMMWKCTLKLKNFQDTIQYCNNLIMENPQNKFAYNTLANSQAEVQQLDIALSCYQRVIEIDPNNRQAHYNLGVTYNQLGMHSEAAQQFKKTTEIDPQMVQAYQSLGNALRRSKKYDEAIRVTKKTTELNPKSKESYLSLADQLSNLNQTQQALDSYRKVIQIDPNYEKAYHEIFVLLQSKGSQDQIEDMIQFMKEQTFSNPGNKNISQSLDRLRVLLK